MSGARSIGRKTFNKSEFSGWMFCLRAAAFNGALPLALVLITISIVINAGPWSRATFGTSGEIVKRPSEPNPAPRHKRVGPL